MTLTISNRPYALTIGAILLLSNQLMGWGLGNKKRRLRSIIELIKVTMFTLEKPSQPSLHSVDTCINPSRMVPFSNTFCFCVSRKYKYTFFYKQLHFKKSGRKNCLAKAKVAQKLFNNCFFTQNRPISAKIGQNWLKSAKIRPPQLFNNCLFCYPKSAQIV